MTFHPRIDYRELHRSKRHMPVDDGKPFAYTPENRERVEAIAKRYPENPTGRRSAILPALYLVQWQIGYISLSAIPHVASVIGCTAAEVEDVVSFYTMFYTRPMGKFVVQVCRTLPCARQWHAIRYPCSHGANFFGKLFRGDRRERNLPGFGSSES